MILSLYKSLSQEVKDTKVKRQTSKKPCIKLLGFLFLITFYWIIKVGRFDCLTMERGIVLTLVFMRQLSAEAISHFQCSPET